MNERRRVRGRMTAAWIAVLFSLPGVPGCGDDGVGVEVGCTSGTGVPAAVRERLQSEAEGFYDRVRRGELEDVYKNAASAVKEARTSKDFVGPIAHAFREIGLPQALTVDRIVVVRFGPEFPFRSEVECGAEGEDAPLTLLLTNHPVQALVVHTGRPEPETFFFSTLWHLEKDAWRLAGFFVKPATLGGEGWEHYADWSDAQRLERNMRNAALLCNVAIDLVVPNAWMQPPELETLRRRQRRISVDRLPISRVDLWTSPPDTFRVFHSAYVTVPELAVLFRYLPPADLADTTALAVYSDRLRAYVEDSFPEYPEVFSKLVLQAVAPDDPNRSWTRVYPLAREP